MNLFVCNYMNLVVNVLHMLLMLSPSMSTALSSIMQTFLMNLVISTFTLVSDWFVSVVRVILPCMLWQLHLCRLLCRKLCMSFFRVFLAELGLIPFKLELTFTFLSLWSVGTSHAHSLTHCINHILSTDRVILLASMRHRGQGITLRPTAWTPTLNGLRSNWEFLLGRSPWHVGGSSTINTMRPHYDMRWFHPSLKNSPLLYRITRLVSTRC